MVQPSTNPPIADEVPWAETITEYDEAHYMVYLRLLDAKADGASMDEMARIVLGINPAHEPQRAKKAVASHLSRAKWMSERGYRRLVGHRNDRLRRSQRSDRRKRPGVTPVTRRKFAVKWLWLENPAA